MMNQSGVINCHAELQLVYKEEVVPVEFVAPGPQECVVCVTVSFESLNIFTSRTAASGTPLHTFLSKFTNTELPFCPGFAKYICRRCFHLANVLEKAEMEYVKLKTTFERIINRNPLFHLPVRLEIMKEQESLDSGDDESDLMSKNTEMCITVEDFPNKEICNDGNTVIIQEPKTDGSDTNSSLEEVGKSFLGEDTDDEYSPNGKHRSQSRTKKVGPKCTICRRQFTCKRNLQRHLEIHYDKKSYECNICQRRFNVHAYLKTHLKTHGVVYECHVCQRHFNSKDCYDSHVATHEGEGAREEMPYSCDFCPRRFRHKGRLSYHVRLHASEKPEYEDYVYKLFSENGESNLIDDTSFNSGLEELKTNVPGVETTEGNG